ncbi:MAG: Coenzyme F420 hydrogenase/dehydrogenase, beta subunit C-terminal domain [Pseudomonadota bacterium]
MDEKDLNYPQPGFKAGPGDLSREVLEKNRCTVCGACVGTCPYFSYQRGRVAMRDRCGLARGRCYDFCPMAGARGNFEGELGACRKVLIAQATQADILKRSQYGGVVSSLAALALNLGLIGEMILTSGHPEDPPHGIRAVSRSQVIASAGSRYAASGAAAALNEALAEPSRHPLGMVGLPCQIKAAAAMRRAAAADVKFDPGRIKILIGLFCTWALDFRQLEVYLKYMLFGERASGFDIPPPPADVFKVYTGDGIKAFPLAEIRPMRLNACRFCDDMTAVMADISVGSVEGLEGWNTVIVRTKAGEKLLNLALEKKILQVDEFPARDLEHLKEASLNKKERSRSAWESEG